MSLISLEVNGEKSKPENKMYVILLYSNILLVRFVLLELRLGCPLYAYTLQGP